MKRPSSDLYDLIHALDAQEARYCKSRMRETDSRSAEIFEWILQQDEYDEEALRKAVGPALKGNQWSVAKHYLYQNILAFLMHRRRNEFSAWNIRVRLQYLDILFGKELYGQCRKSLKHIERAATKLDHPMLLHEVLQWYFKLHQRNYHRVDHDEFEALSLRFRSNAEALEEYTQYQYLHQEFLYRLRTKGLFKGKNRQEMSFADLLSHPLLQSDTTPRSRAARILYLYIHGTFSFISGNPAQARDHFAEIVDLMQAHSGYQQIDPGIYFGALYWRAISCIQTLDFEPARATARKMASFRASSAFYRARLFFYRSELYRAWLS
ncbi:MAG: hypothetical protein AAF570_23920, partial [Bacteroidota bacterium]